MAEEISFTRVNRFIYVSFFFFSGGWEGGVRQYFFFF